MRGWEGGPREQRWRGHGGKGERASGRMPVRVKRRCGAALTSRSAKVRTNSVGERRLLARVTTGVQALCWKGRLKGRERSVGRWAKEGGEVHGSIRTTRRQVHWGQPLDAWVRSRILRGRIWRHPSASRGGHCTGRGKAPLGRLLHAAAGAWGYSRDVHHGLLLLAEHVAGVNKGRGAPRAAKGHGAALLLRHTAPAR